MALSQDRNATKYMVTLCIIIALSRRHYKFNVKLFKVCPRPWGLLQTYGLATRHACYSPATRRVHVWFSQDEEVFTQQVTRTCRY